MQSMDRRSFLSGAGSTVLASLLSGCVQANSEAPVQKDPVDAVEAEGLYASIQHEVASPE